MAGRGGLGFGREWKWVRRRFCAFRLDVEADGEGVFGQACGGGGDGGVGIEYAVIEGPRSEEGSVLGMWNRCGGRRRGEDVGLGLGFAGSGRYG